MPPKRASKPTSKPTPAPKSKSNSKSKLSSTTKETPSRPSRSTRAPQPQAPNPPFTEMEILSAFDSYAVTRSNIADEDEVAAYDEEVDEDDDPGMIRVPDVRRCLRAIGLPPAPSDFFDDNQIFVSRDDFLALAQTLADSAGDADEADDDEEDAVDAEYEDDEGGAKASKGKRSKQEDEIDDAFALFFPHGARAGASERRITLADLKRVARSLKENVDEKTLRLMIEEANGEMGKESVSRGVGRAEFEDVMRRARVFN